MDGRCRPLPAGRRFLVRQRDGQVIQLPLLSYLIMAAIAEGGVDGGWSADQVGARVGAASGQGLTADNVRYLIAGTLAPLGLIAAGGTDRPDHQAPGPALLRHRAAGPAGAAGRVSSGAIACRVASPPPWPGPWSSAARPARWPADTVRADTVRADTVRADTVRADTVRAGSAARTGGGGLVPATVRSDQ